mgnify:CR=1 FL=1
MKQQILAVCDQEAAYAERFCDYVRKKGDYPFTAAAFTSVEKLTAYCRKEKVDVLLVSERMDTPSLREAVTGTVIILRSEAEETGEGESIYRYQSCETILRELMRQYAGHGPQTTGRVKRCGNIRMIGMYSPIHRCMQTTFAITMGEILAKKHKTLYLNFESFSGLEKRFGREFMTDMSDLIYYVTNAREALFYKLKGMTETIGNLDYIPPAFSCMDLARIVPEQWMAMFRELEYHTDYEYLILDLSENMQGLFDILRICERVYTLIRDDSMAQSKLYQYEKLLERADYEDVLQKTNHCKLPFIRQIPISAEQITHGELADYIRKLMREEGYGA